jgi:hypothetical protein
VTFADVGSDMELRSKASKQLIVTVDAKVRVLTHGPIIPYVTIGSGVIVSPGGEMSASLDGHYTFQNFGFPKFEGDDLSVDYKEKPIAPLLVYGVGVDGNLGRHAGWRLDFRALSRKNSDTTELEARANRAIATPQAQNAFAFFTDPAIQFSNSPNFPSSLGGNIDSLETFHGTGRNVQTMISAGIFFRY